MHVLTNIYYRVFDRGLCAIDVAISLSIKFWNVRSLMLILTIFNFISFKKNINLKMIILFAVIGKY